MSGPETRIVLTVVEGPDEGRRFLLHGEPAILGRKGSDLVLSDATVARRHAALEWVGEGYAIRRLDSGRGLRVDGREVEEAPLEHLAEIRLGETVLIVTVGLEESRAGEETFLAGTNRGTATDPGSAASPGSGGAPGGPAAPPAAYLLVVEGAGRGRAFRLTEERTVLGRSRQEVDVWVDDPLVSRCHAEIVREGERYRVRDLASRHGTSCNGEPVHDSALSDGDTLGLMGVQLRFLLGETRLQEETLRLRDRDGE